MGLSPPPRPIGSVDPIKPDGTSGIGGNVLLRVYVNERGRVDRIEVVRSSPPGVFDAAAMAAFGGVPYSPGLLGGVPVAAYTMFEVVFPAAGAGANAGARSY